MCEFKKVLIFFEIGIPFSDLIYLDPDFYSLLSSEKESGVCVGEER